MPMRTLPAERIARLIRHALAEPGRPPNLPPLEWVALAEHGYPDPATMRGHLPYLDRMGRKRIAFTMPARPRGRHPHEARP